LELSRHPAAPAAPAPAPAAAHRPYEKQKTKSKKQKSERRSPTRQAGNFCFLLSEFLLSSLTINQRKRP